MAKKVKLTKTKKATKARVKKINKSILKTSEAMLSVYVQTGEKWHQLLSETITMTEPLREKQIDMFFDTADKVIGQIENGADRFQTLLGIQEPISKIIKEQINPSNLLETISIGASKVVSTIKGVKISSIADAVKMKMEVSDEPVKKVKKKVKKAKKNVKARAKKAPKKVAKSVAKAAAVAKKTATKATKTVKKTTAKATAPVKKTVAKAATSAKKTVKKTVKKATPVKMAVVKKDNLRLIHGVGPKMEKVLLSKGVATFKALSTMGVKNLSEVMAEAGPAYKSYKATNWVAQAKLAAKGDMVAMEKWLATNVK